MHQGVAAGSAPVLLFTDADIVHDPRHLSALVARLQAPRVDLVSEMVRLNCTSLAERALVPAFVYFFQMLYPFARVNAPGFADRRRGRRDHADSPRGAATDRRHRSRSSRRSSTMSRSPRP